MGCPSINQSDRRTIVRRAKESAAPRHLPVTLHLTVVRCTGRTDSTSAAPLSAAPLPPRCVSADSTHASSEAVFRGGTPLVAHARYRKARRHDVQRPCMMVTPIHGRVSSTSSKHVTESDFVHRPIPPFLYRSSVVSTTGAPSRKPRKAFPRTSTRNSCQVPDPTFASPAFNWLRLPRA